LAWRCQGCYQWRRCRNGAATTGVIFRYLGKQHAFTIGEGGRDEAEAKAAQVDYLLMRLRQQLIALPDGTDIVTFVRHYGKSPESV
jgi:hypothetical protein